MIYLFLFIGKCKTQVELNEVCRLHESLKVKYTNTLYDSRCIILGVNGNPDEESLPTPSNFKSQALFYNSDGDFGSTFESQLTDFLSSLFWVLESKRLERCREKVLSLKKTEILYINNILFFISSTFPLNAVLTFTKKII